MSNAPVRATGSKRGMQQAQHSLAPDAGRRLRPHVQGSAVYVPEKDAMLWRIKNFPGGREFLMRCRFALPSVAAEEVQTGRLPPIRVNFEIPYLTVSGIQVMLLPLRRQ